MEQRNEQLRNANSAAADGSDLLLSQANLWIGMGAALAGVLRRMRRGSQPPMEEAADGATTDGDAGHRPASDEEAA